MAAEHDFDYLLPMGPEDLRISSARAVDLEGWSRLRYELWPHVSCSEHAAEAKKDLADGAKACFLAFRGDDLVGFIEVGLRSVVDGRASSPVGYIEGWYVVASERGRGVGRRLVAAGEAWARAKGCTEMGSDAELHNDGSIAAHCALGYEVTGRVVQFRRRL